MEDIKTKYMEISRQIFSVNGTSKDLISEKGKIKCKNMIKQYKNDQHWWCYKRKHKIT